MVTSVIVSVFAIDPAKEVTIIEDIQAWLRDHDHAPFFRIDGGFESDSGGEKALTCDLLIGAFDWFETNKFREWLALHPSFDPTGEHTQIELIVKEVDREEFARWKILPIGKGSE